MAYGRRNRLGLTPVNQNPQPPNAPRSYGANTRGGAGSGGPNASGHGPHNGNQNRGNQGQGHQGHNQGGGHHTPGHDHNQGNGGGGGNQGGGGGNGGGGGGGHHTPPYSQGAGAPDPRDQTYYANVARLQAEEAQNLANVNLTQAYANTDYTKAQEGLALNQQQDTQNLANDALRSGLSSSGYLNNQSANLITDYSRQGASLSMDKARSDFAREAAKEALIQGLPMDVAAEYAAAADRYAQLQATQAGSGAGINKHKDLKAIKKLLNGGGGRNRGGGGNRGNHGGRH